MSKDKPNRIHLNPTLAAKTMNYELKIPSQVTTFPVDKYQMKRLCIPDSGSSSCSMVSRAETRLSLRGDGLLHSSTITTWSPSPSVGTYTAPKIYLVTI